MSSQGWSLWNSLMGPRTPLPLVASPPLHFPWLQFESGPSSSFLWFVFALLICPLQTLWSELLFASGDTCGRVPLSVAQQADPSSRLAAGCQGTWVRTLTLWQKTCLLLTRMFLLPPPLSGSEDLSGSNSCCLLAGRGWQGSGSRGMCFSFL